MGSTSLEEERKNNPAGYMVRRVLHPGLDTPASVFEERVAEGRAAQQAAATRATIFSAGVRAGYKF